MASGSRDESRKSKIPYTRVRQNNVPPNLHATRHPPIRCPEPIKAVMNCRLLLIRILVDVSRNAGKNQLCEHESDEVAWNAIRDLTCTEQRHIPHWGSGAVLPSMGLGRSLGGRPRWPRDADGKHTGRWTVLLTAVRSSSWTTYSARTNYTRGIGKVHTCLTSTTTSTRRFCQRSRRHVSRKGLHRQGDRGAQY